MNNEDLTLATPRVAAAPAGFMNSMKAMMAKNVG